MIVFVLAITVVASLLRSRRDPQARAHTGSLRDTRDDRRNRAAEDDSGGNRSGPSRFERF